MRTRSSSNLPGESSPNPTSSNPKHHNRRRLKQLFILKESPVDTMAGQRTMAELLRAPTAGYAEAIMVPSILLEQFELKHNIINMMTSDQTTNLRNEISNFQQRFDESFHGAWDRYKDLLHACPRHGFAELHQLDTFYNALNPADQDSLNYVAGGNLLERHTQDVLTIIENKSKDNIQGYVSAAAVNYNQGNSDYRLPGSRPLLSNTIANPKGKLKSITTRSGIVLDGPSVSMPPPFINQEEDERVEETLTDSEFGEFTIKVPPPLVQKLKPPSQRNYVVHQMDPLHPNIPYPLRMHKQKQQEKDEVQIHKFWQMFKQLHINITLADALILILNYHKMLKALLSNKEKLLELTNSLLNENCSAVILKKLLEKLKDLGKFLILCGFSELKCKALADLGASINLMPLFVWKKIGLPELISTRMTLELDNRAIYTPAGITRDVFVLVGKFTFPADFVIIDYESNPRVPLILGRPFLRTARALIDVHGEEMILRDGDKRLTLIMRHDTSSYSNQPQKESIYMINIDDDSCEDFLEDFFETNHLSGNPTFSSHINLTPEVKDDIFDPEGDTVLVEKLINLDSTKDLPPPYNINPLSGSTTSSSPNYLLEEFTDEFALITFPPEMMIFRLISNPILDNLDNPNDNLVDTMPKMFTSEHALDYSSPLLYDEYDDDLVEFESSDFLPSPEYDSFLFEDFSKFDVLPSTNNEDKVFNLGIFIQEKLFEVTIRVAPDKNVKKIAIPHASLILEDFDPPLYELPLHKEVLASETLLSILSENEEKVFKPRILTSKGVHSSLLLKLSHRGPKVFKVTKIFENPMEIFPCSYGEDIRVLDVSCLHFCPP
nr:reverse transcriptase domain-containing protein [Tanacetum cinerariifolium]